MLVVSFRRLVDRMNNFSAKTIPIQSARALLAAATLSILISTPWDKLSPELAGIGRTSYCKPPLNLGLFCIDTNPHKSLATGISIAVLTLVILGFVPAISSLLHAWVAISFSVGIGLPDGGDQVAQVITVLVFVMSIDNWSWCAWYPKVGSVLKSEKLSNLSSGVRWAGWVGLRLQVAYIYLDSGISKLSRDDWLNGSAMYYFVRDPSFGASGEIGNLARWFTSFDWGVAFLTWSPILMEIAIALLIFGRGIHRTTALTLAVLLHVGIIVVIGLWSFGCIMIASVGLAALPGVTQLRWRNLELAPRRYPRFFGCIMTYLNPSNLEI